MDKNILLTAIGLLISIAVTIFAFGAGGLVAILGVVIVAVIAAALYYSKNLKLREALLVLTLWFVFAFLFYIYLNPAVQIASGSGTVLSDNWFQALSWMRNNTPECSVVATYWDPGHFITGIARRAVVFDGASQGDLYSRPANFSSEGLIVEKFDSNINHIVMFSDGNKTTARIQDISTTLLTVNETLAIEILMEYRRPGCDSMYYIASADLIGKSTWWTYFATWNPVDKKGTPYVYTNAPQPGFSMSARPDIRQNAIIYTYPISPQDAFVLYESKNASPVVFLQQQGIPEPLRVARFLYFTPDGSARIFTQSDSKIDGMLFIEPSKQSVLFIPPQLENALFTRMFLFNGFGLEHFEPVGPNNGNWGGEVKVYRVKF